MFIKFPGNNIAPRVQFNDVVLYGPDKEYQSNGSYIFTIWYLLRGESEPRHVHYAGEASRDAALVELDRLNDLTKPAGLVIECLTSPIGIERYQNTAYDK